MDWLIYSPDQTMRSGWPKSPGKASDQQADWEHLEK